MFHAITVLVCTLGIAAVCVIGRRAKQRDPAAEQRLRHRVAWCMIGWQTFATIWRLLPMNYTIEESWPLHLCRVVGWVAPFMLMSHHRRLRAVVHFWGLGLSTQGCFTPFWNEGLLHVGYWLFWVGHTLIVGAAIYDLTVHGWGPRFRDWGFAALWGLLYAGLAIGLNIAMGTNYSYLGRGEYDATSVVSLLGEWPERPLFMILGAQLVMLMLYGAAVLGRRLKHTRNIPATPNVDNTTP